MLQQPEANLFIYLFPPPPQLSHFAPKMTNQPQENLVKSGYKTNRKAKNLGIPITCWWITRTYLLTKYGNFKKRKKNLEICPNHPKILAISKHFSSKCGKFFLGIFQKVPFNMLFGLFCLIKTWGVFTTKKSLARSETSQKRKKKIAKFLHLVSIFSQKGKRTTKDLWLDISFIATCCAASQTRSWL